jgi:hypothetical protein
VTTPDHITVMAESESGFRVEVRGPRGTTTYNVTVPAGFAGEVGWAGNSEADLVQESFAFLLEREPASSILPRFSLDVIARFFPEYPAEIRDRRPSG